MVLLNMINRNIWPIASGATNHETIIKYGGQTLLINDIFIYAQSPWKPHKND